MRGFVARVGKGLPRGQRSHLFARVSFSRVESGVLETRSSSVWQNSMQIRSDRISISPLVVSRHWRFLRRDFSCTRSCSRASDDQRRGKMISSPPLLRTCVSGVSLPQPRFLLDLDSRDQSLSLVSLADTKGMRAGTYGQVIGASSFASADMRSYRKMPRLVTIVFDLSIRSAAREREERSVATRCHAITPTSRVSNVRGPR